MPPKLSFSYNSPCTTLSRLLSVPYAHPISFFLIWAISADLLNLVCEADNVSKIWYASRQHGIKYINRKNEKVDHMYHVTCAFCTSFVTKTCW
jgi:hypothetical protein